MAKKNNAIRLLTSSRLDNTVTVDRESGNGVIRNVSIITRGPAVGHGYDVDDVMVRQVYQSIKRKPRGVKSRITHPEVLGFFGGGDAIEFLVGKCFVTELTENKCRGDIHFGKYANDSPKGRLADYLMGLAEEDPGNFGLSISYVADEFEQRSDENDQSLPPAGRVRDVLAVDFVGDPGANPDGLLSSGSDNDPGDGEPEEQNRKELLMNPELRAFLESVGLKKDATDEQATAYLAKLPEAQRKAANALTAAGETPKDNGAEPAPEPTPEPAGTPTGLSAGGSVDPTQLGKLIEDKVNAALNSVERPRQISALAAQHNVEKISPGWTERMLKSGLPMADIEAHAKALAKAGEASAITVGSDRNLDSLGEAMSDAFCLNAGVKIEEPHERALSFGGMGAYNLGVTYLQQAGVHNVLSLSRHQVAELLLQPRKLYQLYPETRQLSMSTSDFDYILESSLRKSLRAAYEVKEATWNKWCQRGKTQDFKQNKRVQLSEAPNLVSLPEGGEIDYATLGEAREVFAISRFASGIMITYETFINDDLGAFGRLPMMLAASAKRLEDISAYAILTANAAMADGTSLFDSDHSNVASSGGALSVTTLGAGRSAMRLQTGIKGKEILNIVPKVLIVPSALETAAEQLIFSAVDPAETNNTVNPFRGKLEVIAEPILDDTSTAGWYLAANPNEFDTVEVCFMMGAEEPQLSQEDEFATGNRKYAVTHTLGSKAIDHRGLYYNEGASE